MGGLLPVSHVEELSGLSMRFGGHPTTTHECVVRRAGAAFFRRVDTSELRNGILAFVPNNLHCSFCNQSEDQTGPLLAKMDAGPKRRPVRICKDCAEMA